MRTETLAGLPAETGPARLATVDEQIVALGESRMWRLDSAGKSWIPLEWENPLDPARTVLVGSDVILVSAAAGSGGALSVERLALEGGRLVARLGAEVPAGMGSLRATVADSRLWLAGLGPDGRGRLVSLSVDAPASGWTEHSGWAAGGRGPNSLVWQDESLLLTTSAAAGGGDELWRWTAAEGWRKRADLPGQVVEGAAQPLGQAHVLLLLRFPAGPAAAYPKLQLYTYHTITSALTPYGESWEGGILAGAGWRNGLAWLEHNGGVARASIHGGKQLLHALDWIVLVVYLVGVTGIGLYFYLREKKHSTADFFVGGRSIPFWAAGISLYATNTSSISYIAIPAKAFATNWQYLMNNLVAVLGLMFVAVWIVPLLRRLDLMSVFHYLEIRFHPGIRTLTSALCIAMQLGGRMSVVLYLPSLAIATITGLDVVWSILIMGGITILYTSLGGMKAVIWTDVAQLFVMFGGALFAIGFIVSRLDGGLGELLAVARAEDKMRLADWSFDLTKATVWGFVFLVLFDVVLTFPKDQVLMQRVLSTSSGREARRSVWTFAAIMVPGGFMFYLIGTALYAFYQAHPERMNPLLRTDATFPLFIAAELPVGVTGLIIAGVVAASMSTLSSILNSVATLASVDFYEKWAKNPDPARGVRIAEWLTVAAGLVGMGLALLLTRYDINSLFDVSIELSGLLSGGFAGAYTLGMFTRRANWQGVALGIAVSIGLTVLAWSRNLVHPYFYMPISILICIVVGWLGSLFFPPPAVPLQGLTIFRSERDSASAA